MQRHSFKDRMKYQKFRLCFVFLKSSTSALIFKDILTLIGLWGTTPLEFQPQPHYRMSSSLANNSPTSCPPLKESIRGR